MAIGIDDLYDDDDELQPEELSTNDLNGFYSEPQEVQEEQNDDDSFMLDFLKSKGIDDPSDIKFVDDNNQVISRNWNDLSRQELINILNTPLTQNNSDNYDLDNEEVELLNNIRNSGLTPSQFVELLKQPEVVQAPQYKVDDFSDDELYLLDLESRVGELSEEQAAEALAQAKQNEELYNKQVQGIRNEYKEREEYNTLQELALIENEQLQAYQEYQGLVINAIDQFNSVGNLDINLEDSDKEYLAEFMLSQDENGYNHLYKALQDPQTLVKAAWFILNGDEAFDSISDYFTNLIKLVSRNQYERGFLDGQNGNKPASNKPGVVIQHKPSRTAKMKTIDDLYDED